MKIKNIVHGGTVFQVGKPFPIPVQNIEGTSFEVMSFGMTYVLYMPGTTKEEIESFKYGFRRYGIYVHQGKVPLIVWAFHFPNHGGAGVMDGSFDAKAFARNGKQAILDDFMAKDTNLLNLFLLDNGIVKAQKIVGLNPDAVEYFKVAIRMQLAADYTQDDFDLELMQLFRRYDSNKLLEISQQFKHEPKTKG